MATRVPVSSVTAFTNGATSLLCKFNNVTLSVDLDMEDGECLNDFWKKVEVAGGSWKIEGAGLIDAAPYFIPLMISAPNTALALTIDAGDAGAFTGNAKIMSSGLDLTKRSNIKETVSLVGHGALAYAA